MRIKNMLTLAATGLALTAFAASTSACDKKKDDAAAEGDKAKKGGDKKAAPAGPKAQSATDFFVGINKMKGMEAMKTYKEGILINGKVKRTLTEMNKAVKVMLVAGEKPWVTLSFKDKGVAVTKAAVKAGDELKAQCKLGGGTDAYYMLVDCELK